MLTSLESDDLESIFSQSFSKRVEPFYHSKVDQWANQYWMATYLESDGLEVMFSSKVIVTEFNYFIFPKWINKHNIECQLIW